VIDLSTKYLGLELRSPLMASAGPLTARLDTLLRLEEAGAAAVVLPSLFEEQIVHDSMDLHHLLETAAWSHPEALGYFPEMEDYNTGPRDYLESLEAAKEALEIPVIASLNGSSLGGWVRFARWLEDAGADAVELNVYYVAADPYTSGRDVENRYVELVSEVRRAVSLPVAVKLGPYFSSMAQMARRLAHAGADGLVLFNRFLQPDIDLDTLEVVPALDLSSSSEARLPLRWVAILRGVTDISLAATGGVHEAEDAVKMILAGADVVMMTSALLKRGPEHIAVMQDGVARWLEERAYGSVAEARGSLSQLAVPDPAAFERSNYMHALIDYTSSFLAGTREAEARP
jgi:dihydroorotate dehydrogenase (fumarate)